MLFVLKMPTPLTRALLHKLSLCSVFQYIGSLDVPRPSSRVEIVAAMRRIRVSSKELSLMWNKKLPSLE